MNEDRLGKLESAVGEMTTSISSLVIELKHSNENFRTQQLQHKEDIAELKLAGKVLSEKVGIQGNQIAVLKESNKDFKGAWDALRKMFYSMAAGLLLMAIVAGVAFSVTKGG